MSLLSLWHVEVSWLLTHISQNMVSMVQLHTHSQSFRGNGGGWGGGFPNASCLLSVMGRILLNHWSTQRRADIGTMYCCCMFNNSAFTKIISRFPCCHFRWTTEKCQQCPQIMGTLFTGPSQGNQPRSWLWMRRLPGGQTPVRSSVMLWMTSCLWPAAWADPVGSRCSACTPSAGSRNACCHFQLGYESVILVATFVPIYLFSPFILV